MACLHGAASGKQEGTSFVFQSKQSSGSLVLTNSSFVARRNVTVGGIGSVVGRSSINFDGTSITDNVIDFGSSKTVEKTDFGLKVLLPASEQIEINGHRFRVQDLVQSNAARVATPVAEREKVKIYRVSLARITDVYVYEYAKLTLSRFPQLAVDKVDFRTMEYSELCLDGDFAVRNLKATTVGYSKIKPREGSSIFAEETTLETSSYSKLLGVNVTGKTAANSSGYSSLEVHVGDKSKADGDQSGFSKCRVLLMKDEMRSQAATALAKLNAPKTAAAAQTAATADAKQKKRERSADVEEGDSSAKRRK